MSVLERPTVMYPPEPQKLWTVKEYHLLQRTGFLQGRYELIDGVIVEKLKQTDRQSMYVRALMCKLASIFSIEQLMVYMPIRIAGEAGQYLEPRPCIAISREGYEEYDESPTPADTLLVVEVSEDASIPIIATLSNMYGAIGISEYWLVDIKQRRLRVHRKPSTLGGYEDVEEWIAGHSIAPLAKPESAIALVDILLL